MTLPASRLPSSPASPPAAVPKEMSDVVGLHRGFCRGPCCKVEEQLLRGCPAHPWSQAAQHLDFSAAFRVACTAPRPRLSAPGGSNRKRGGRDSACKVWGRRYLLSHSPPPCPDSRGGSLVAPRILVPNLLARCFNHKERRAEKRTWQGKARAVVLAGWRKVWGGYTGPTATGGWHQLVGSSLRFGGIHRFHAEKSGGSFFFFFGSSPAKLKALKNSALQNFACRRAPFLQDRAFCCVVRRVGPV